MPDQYIPFLRSTRGFVYTAVGATVAAWVVVLSAAQLGLGYPYNVLLPPVRPLFDFYDYYDSFRLLHTASFFYAPDYPFTYMPSGVFLYQAFYVFGPREGFLVYLAIVVVAIWFGFARVRCMLLQRGLQPFHVDTFMFVLLFSSYPIGFCLERGNLEIILAIGIAVGAWAYTSGKTLTASILWGLCGSVKIYPLLLLALFISARQYRRIYTCIGSAAVTTLAALIYIGPTVRIAVLGIRSSIAAFLAWYALRFEHDSIGFDHSLFALLKILLRPFNFPLSQLLQIYLPTAGFVALVLYFAKVRHLPFANQFLFLTAASILLPPASFDYTLVQLYAPLVVLLLVVIDTHATNVTPIFVTMGLLFTPTNFFFLHGESFAGQIKAVLLLALLWLSIARPVGSTQTSIVGESEPEWRRRKDVRAGDVRVR